MNVAVTGGTGFVGTAACRILEQRGHRVVPLSRRLGVDIRDLDALTGRLPGMDAVVHLAALVQSRPGPFDAVNLEGLRHVLEACRQSGVHRLIYVSSFTVFGPGGPEPRQLTGLVPATRHFHDYDRTKAQALALLQDWRNQLDITVLYPTVVYGPGPLTEGNLLIRVFRQWLDLGIALLPRRGRAVWNFVHVEDVAVGIGAVLPRAPAGDYLLGGDNRSLAELVERLSRISGRRLRMISVPDWLFRLGARLEDRWASVRGRPPLVTPATAEFMFHHWAFSSDEAERDLGYRPRSLADGLADTWQWMVREKIV